MTRDSGFDGERYVSVGSATVMPKIITPDDIMDGKLPDGPTLVYDEDGYYIGEIIVKRLKAAGLDVTLATTDEVVSSWAGKTSERWKVCTHLMRLGIDIIVTNGLVQFYSRRLR